ncbi:low molecular weight protein-tyrosine-phosphatase [Megasphaera sp.]|uniref:low molecular weight protein-tyrosine-phosphatase n=1 Tax=Megasphaera sp. TaxID=2023260 RepID=UPI0025C6AEC1|nr:low molecular weight protein-tyrosine-phosphatase [Megasphaera sp.]MCF0153520.1 low molecular weight phosphotyrosine protein phosphatase [Megasphaera sp.]
MIKILFVCHGNICRSPMAEFVFRQMVEQDGLADRVEVASAATTDEEIWNGYGNPVYPPVERLLRAHGMDPDGKRAVLLTADDYGTYDYFIGMDDENLRDMQRIFHGDTKHKCSLLLDYTAAPRSVADPWYTRDFQRTWDDVQEGCRGLLAFLQDRLADFPASQG